MTDLATAFDWLGDSKNIEALKKIRFEKHDRFLEEWLLEKEDF